MIKMHRSLFQSTYVVVFLFFLSPVAFVLCSSINDDSTSAARVIAKQGNDMLKLHEDSIAAPVPSLVSWLKHPFTQVITDIHKAVLRYVPSSIDIPSKKQFLRNNLKDHQPYNALNPKEEWGAKGLWYDRWVTGKEFTNFSLTFDDGNCDESDEYGDNDCKFDWGETVSGEVNVGVLVNVVEGDTFSYSLNIKAYDIASVLDWEFSCPACGDDDCTINIPEMLQPELNMTKYDVKLQPCPVSIPVVAQEKISKTLPDEDTWENASKGVNIYTYEEYHLKNTKGHDRLMLKTKIVAK